MPRSGRWAIGWCRPKAAARKRPKNREGLRAPGRRRRPDKQVQKKNPPPLTLRPVRLSGPMGTEPPWRRRRFCKEPRREESRQRPQKRSSTRHEAGHWLANFGHPVDEAAQRWSHEAGAERRAYLDGGLSGRGLRVCEEA